MKFPNFVSYQFLKSFHTLRFNRSGLVKMISLSKNCDFKFLFLMAIFTDVPTEDLIIGFSKHLTFGKKIISF